MFDPYMCSVTNEYVIDKTEALEKAVRAYPSVYLEGAAASGKTTAVRMLLEKYPQVRTQVFWIEEERKDADAFLGKLSGVKERMKQETVWVILENLSAGVPETVMTAIVNLIYDLPPECRVLLVSRERPWEALLELLWKRNMELLPQKTLLFTKEEVRRLASHMESTIHPEEIYEETGGWAGCTDLMLRLSVKGKGEEKRTKTAKMLRNSYEIHTYIKKEILDTLTEAEKEIMRRGRSARG